jgi:HTH-type transcriptional regulator/antitoxin HigA
MKLKPIKSEKEYKLALKRLEAIFDTEPGSKHGDEFELLSILIEKYEEDNHAIDLPDPIEAIKFRMEQLGMNQKELSQIVGYKSRVSEILNKKRKLTLKMIRNLKEKLSIPSDVLIQDY